MARKQTKAKKPEVTKGVGALLFPGNNLAATTTTLPDTGVSMAAQVNQWNSLQPTNCYEMSIAVRKAISAITCQANRSQARVFTKDGDEVVSGPLIDLLKHPAKDWTTKRFLNDIMHSWLITGAVGISLLLSGGNGLDFIPTETRPLGMIPLACQRLYPINPTNPNELCDVNTWMYTVNSGITIQYPACSVIFVPNYNPNTHITPLSNLITGVNAATVGYQALRYMKDFYTNNAVPSHIVELREKLSPKQIKDWKETYLEQYSTFNNQSQKVIVSSGTEVQIHKIDTEQKTGEQINLLKYSDEQIASLYSVPPTVMGNFSNVRFETASIERSLFLEDSVLPLISTIQEILQWQLVDRFFSHTGTTFKRGKSHLPMTKNLKNILAKKLSENVDSEFVIILDPSEIPLMSQVNIDKFTSLETVALKGHMSINEAAEYLNMELEYSPLRDKIFISSGLVELTDNPNDQGVLPLKDETNDEAKQSEHSNDASMRTMTETEKENDLKPLDERDSKKVKSLRSIYRTIRKHTLINNGEGKVYSLKEIDDLCLDIYKDVPQFKKQIRKDLYNLKHLLKNKTTEEKTDAIRAFYNGKKASVLRELV